MNNPSQSENSQNTQDVLQKATDTAASDGHADEGMHQSAPRYSPPYYSTWDSELLTSPLPQKEKPVLKGAETLLAYLSIILGFLFFRALPVIQTPLGSALLLCLFFAVGALYLHVSKIPVSRSAIALAVVLCLLSFGLVTQANKTLQRLLFAAVLLSFLYWSYSVCGLAGKKLFGDRLVPHALHAIFVIPFRSAGQFFRSLPIRRRGKESNPALWRSVGWILVGLLVAVIPTAIAVSLLSYDKSFTNLLSRLFSFSLDGVWEYVRDLLLGLLVAIPLFSALFTSKRCRERNEGEEEKLNTPNLHIVPKPLLCAAVTPVLIVYVLFFISQWNYYVSAFTHTLPEGLPSYAAYARAGFFELCRVCALNALMLLVFNLLLRKEKKEPEAGTERKKRDILQSVYSVLISLFTLVLIATALSKMILYINSYGLTQKRVYTSWLMLLLAAVFILVLLHQLIPRLSLIRAITVTVLVFFALLVLPDTDAMIASYNVDAYLSGNLSQVDIQSISEYGVSAVPALDRLCDELDSRSSQTEKEQLLLKQASSVLDTIERDLEDTPNHIFAFHIPTQRAKRILQERS